MTSLALACVLALAVAGCNRATPPPPGATSSAPVAPPSSATTTAAPGPSGEPATSATPAASDGAIDALVARLRPSHGLWSNGHFPKLDSPAGATTSEVLKEMFSRGSYAGGTVSTFAIREERDVRIGGAYRAARLDTDRGKMVVLLRYDRNRWWTRAFPE